MNLAEATAALGKKESEKMQIMEEIESLEAVQMEGTVAYLHSTVYGLKNLPDNREPSFEYKYFPEGSEDSTMAHSGKTVSEPAQFSLSSKNGKLSVTCTLKSTTVSSEPAETEEPAVEKCMVYVGEISLSEIPEENEMRTELVTQLVEDGSETDETAKTLSVQLKVSVDDVGSLIESKTVALKQVQQEFDDIVTAVQDAKKKATTKVAGKKTGGRKVVGKKKASAASTVREAAEDDEAAPAAPSMFDGLQEKIMIAADYAFERRAYVLFPVAVAVFHFFGDYASV